MACEPYTAISSKKKESRVIVLFYSFYRIIYFNMNICIFGHVHEKCYCYREPIKPFTFDASQMTVISLHLLSILFGNSNSWHIKAKKVQSLVFTFMTVTVLKLREAPKLLIRCRILQRVRVNFLVSLLCCFRVKEG